MIKFGVVLALFCLATSVYGADVLKCWDCESLRQPWCANPPFNESMKANSNNWKECPGVFTKGICVKQIKKLDGGVIIKRSCEDAISNIKECVSVFPHIEIECYNCDSSFCNAAPVGVVPVGALIISMLMLMKIFQF